MEQEKTYFINKEMQNLKKKQHLVMSILLLAMAVKYSRK